MRKFKWELLVLLATVFFGISYVFMNIIGKYLEPFSTNFLKFFLAFIVLVPFLFKKDNTDTKSMLIGGFLISITTFVATFAQQAVANYVSSAKIGFITSMYIVFVPFLSYFFYKNKPTKNTIIAIIIAVVGLYLLCGIGTLNFNAYDFVVLIAAFGFTFEIVLIDIYSKKVSPIKLTTLVLGFTALFDLVMMLVLEQPNFSSISPIIPEILFYSLGCTGFATIAQTYGQQHTDATLASLIMSLESVVSAIAGLVILNQVLSIREVLGCVIMFIAIILSELPQKKV